MSELHKELYQVNKKNAYMMPAKRNNMAWLLTFTDIMALMLTFFVLLFSMSNPKTEKWSPVVTALGSEFNTKYSDKDQASILNQHSIQRKAFDRGLNLGYVVTILKTMAEQDEVLAQMQVYQQGQKIVISLPSEFLFPSGEADLTKDAKASLVKMGRVLKNLKNKVEIIGYADPNPIATEKFPSNWSLSLMRAENVATFLTYTGYPHDLSVSGTGDGQFMTAPKEWPLEKRHAYARRIDLIIHAYRGPMAGFFN